MRTFVVVTGLIVYGVAVAADQQTSAPVTRFALTIDSIMRGPKLVGYPPSNLRWSGDSKELYFEWRTPGEDEPATWVVGRDGGTPRRLSDEERKSAPLTSGLWDAECRRILGVDRGDIVGRTRVLDAVTDDAWVREIGRSDTGGGLGWLPDNQWLWFLVEHDRWMHLYTLNVSAERPERKQLTSGRFEIDTLQLSPDGTRFYMESTEQHPRERLLYALSSDGGERTRISQTTGGTTGEISPDNATFGIIHSTATRPPEVFVMPNRPGAPMTPVTTSTSAEWRNFNWVEPQLVTYKTRDGSQVYARLYTPEMVGARRHGGNPAVVFVHGAGYLKNAHRYWSSYYREYMFHHLLASKGYVGLDPDYRASAGYGRDWRTAIYRWMGGKDLEAVVDGAKFLVDQHRVHPRRVGVYGGSYGGFITLMAMFTTPEVFAAGAALRPVTDWAHYNHGYTSNILNEPEADVEAYRKSSPIYFADSLKGALLIAHGMVDVNVHLRDSVRLAQRVIELRRGTGSSPCIPWRTTGLSKKQLGRRVQTHTEAFRPAFEERRREWTRD